MENKTAEYLVNTYSDMIFKIAYTWLNNIYDAEDICQDVLIKIINNNDNFQDLGHEKAFVIRVTINTCKNLKKSAWFRRIISLNETSEASVEIELFKEDVILPIVQKLPIKYRNVIFLHYYEELSVSEIAKILDVAPMLVSTHLKRGKEKLKQRLGENYNERFI